MPFSNRNTIRRIGVHTSISGGFHLAIERAKKLGCTTIQIFSHNPRQWNTTMISYNDVARFRELREKYDINPVYIHASYLINLCSVKSENYNKSIGLLEKEMDIADLLNADYIVLHPGSSSEDNLNKARQRAIIGLNSLTERKSWNAKILLENTSSKKSGISSQLEGLSEMLNETSNVIVGGICLDTSHAYAAGYNLANTEGLSDFIKEIKTNIGLEKLKLIHLNDSKKHLNSNIDRHEHIGKGFIGREAIKRILRHPEFHSIPIILETPKKSERDDMINLKRVRSLYK